MHVRWSNSAAAACSWRCLLVLAKHLECSERELISAAGARALLVYKRKFPLAQL
jgi:hypothetical protein